MFTAISANTNRSHRRNEPPATINNNTTAATGTLTYFGSPKNDNAKVTPMKSVTMVNVLRMNRSPTLNQPQNLPNRSKISLA
jgi:hypothetical protein